MDAVRVRVGAAEDVQIAFCQQMIKLRVPAAEEDNVYSYCLFRGSVKSNLEGESENVFL